MYARTLTSMNTAIRQFELRREPRLREGPSTVSSSGACPACPPKPWRRWEHRRRDENAVCIDWTFPLAGRGAARDPAPLLEWVRSTPQGMRIHVILPSRLGESVRSLQYTLQSLGCRVTRRRLLTVMTAPHPGTGAAYKHQHRRTPEPVVRMRRMWRKNVTLTPS